MGINLLKLPIILNIPLNYPFWTDSTGNQCLHPESSPRKLPGTINKMGPVMTGTALIPAAGRQRQTERLIKTSRGSTASPRPARASETLFQEGKKANKQYERNKTIISERHPDPQASYLSCTYICNCMWAYIYIHIPMHTPQSNLA